MKKTWLFSLGAVAMFGHNPSSLAFDFCDTLTALAHDTQKVRYARQRIETFLANAEFREVLERRKSFAPDDARLGKLGGLDWDYLGLGTRWPRLEFNMPTDSDGWDVNSVRSASLRLGRNFVILRLKQAEDLGLSWPPEMLARIRSVADGVFVYCD